MGVLDDALEREMFLELLDRSYLHSALENGPIPIRKRCGAHSTS